MMNQNSKTPNLVIFQINIHSLSPKLNELYFVTKTNNIDILAVQET